MLQATFETSHWRGDLWAGVDDRKWPVGTIQYAHELRASTGRSTRTPAPRPVPVGRRARSESFAAEQQSRGPPAVR